jgi:hypothetical protein
LFLPILGPFFVQRVSRRPPGGLEFDHEEVIESSSEGRLSRRDGWRMKGVRGSEGRGEGKDGEEGGED